jgi:hypothetical protein
VHDFLSRSGAAAQREIAKVADFHPGLSVLQNAYLPL